MSNGVHALATRQGAATATEAGKTKSGTLRSTSGKIVDAASSINVLFVAAVSLR